MNAIVQGSCYYRVYTNDGTGIYGLEMSAIFSREIKPGEKLEIEINGRNGIEIIPLLVERVEKGCLYVKRQEDIIENICFCEIVKTPKMPLGQLHLRRKHTILA